jgi:hypothetical protein
MLLQAGGAPDPTGFPEAFEGGNPPRSATNCLRPRAIRLPSTADAVTTQLSSLGTPKIGIRFTASLTTL